MKYSSTKFEDYTLELERYNLHEEKKELYNNLNYDNLIFYGPSGIGKYSQVLNYINKYSSSNLKYERKIYVEYSNKKQYLMKISDVHFEIDMELLGCNAKVLFNEIFQKIIDIILIRENKMGILVCKNFHKIHSELLDIFYSYMQNMKHKNLNLKYILLTEHVSFIPDNILERCKIISFNRPTKTKYSKCFNINMNDVKLNEITNIKNLCNNITIFKNPNKKLVTKIINLIENYQLINYLEFRDMIYDILIYELDVLDCMNDIIIYFINNDKINNDNLDNILYELDKFLVYYNNNYRPIYHLERFLLYICISVNEL